MFWDICQTGPSGTPRPGGESICYLYLYTSRHPLVVYCCATFAHVLYGLHIVLYVLYVSAWY